MPGRGPLLNVRTAVRSPLGFFPIWTALGAPARNTTAHSLMPSAMPSPNKALVSVAAGALPGWFAAAAAADELERLGKPSILVFHIDIGATAERKSAGKRSDNANVVGPKPHHGPPAALNLRQNAPVCVANMATSSKTRRFRRDLPPIASRLWLKRPRKQHFMIRI